MRGKGKLRVPSAVDVELIVIYSPSPTPVREQVNRHLVVYKIQFSRGTRVEYVSLSCVRMENALALWEG